MKPRHIFRSQLKPGDHIAVKRRAGYTHHGIYVAADRVIHFSDENGIGNKFTTKIKATSLEAFLGGGLLMRVSHLLPYPHEEIIDRAESILAGEEPWQPYCIVRNNCEHFATWCAVRRPSSAQVKRALRVVGAGGFFIASMAAGRRFRRA